MESVFAISAPLRLQDIAARFVPAVDAWNRFMDRFHLEDAKKTFIENHPENPGINYYKNPIAGVRELERLMASLEPKLPEITVPALVVQSQEDPVVNPKGTEMIFKALGSMDKQMVMFNFQRHGILLGEGAQRVYRAVGDFLDHIRKNPSPVVRRKAEEAKDLQTESEASTAEDEQSGRAGERESGRAEGRTRLTPNALRLTPDD